MDMNKIVDRIYQGSAYGASDIDNLTTLGITHVLTIDTQPLKYDVQENITYKFVYCVDMPEADILSSFEQCFKFIDEALTGSQGAILIHCLAGLSRSTTVVAAYLMYRHKMSLDEALSRIKNRRPGVKPNPGFMRQLELFEEMGSNIDPSNEQWRKYKLSMMADKMQAGSVEEFPVEDLLANPGETTDRADNYFKCRKCRQALFRNSGVMTHTVGQGEAAFDWRSKIPGSKTVKQSDDYLCTQSLFIEPVKWMAGSINQLDGKILCPKCHAKLGSFIWYGEKCPCGAWVAPAFHIQRSKVDEVIVKQSSANQNQDKQSSANQHQDTHADLLGLKELSVSDHSTSLTNSDDASGRGPMFEEKEGVKDTILEEILQTKRDKD